MTREEAIEAAADPIRRHLRAWGGSWTAAAVAENLREGWAGGSGTNGGGWQFQRDGIYVSAPGAFLSLQKGATGAIRVSYADAIAAVAGGPVQATLW